MKPKQFLSLILGFTLVFSPQILLSAELSEIIKRGKLIVAVKDNVRPLGFYDQNGELQGLEIEIAKQLAEELLGNREALELIPVSNQERLQLVLDGKVDLVIAQVTATESRLRLVNFSPYYYLDGTGIVTVNPQLQNLRDFEGRKLAVLEGSSTIAQVRSALPRIELIGVESYQEALSLLESGGADGFAGDNSVLTGWVQEYPQYRQLPVRLGADPLVVIMPKGLQYKSLSEQVNSTIKRLHDSGWLEERATYWGLPRI